MCTGSLLRKTRVTYKLKYYGLATGGLHGLFSRVIEQALSHLLILFDSHPKCNRMTVAVA